MQTHKGLEIAVKTLGRGAEVSLAIGTLEHLLDAETALRLGHALAEASAGPPATAFVRSVVTRTGKRVTVDREPAGTGCRVLVARPRTARPALPVKTIAQAFAPAHDEDELHFDLSSADAGELALELLRNAAGLGRQLTFAAWEDGAWLSGRRRPGELELALASVVRKAAPSPAQRAKLLQHVSVLLGTAAPTDNAALAPSEPVLGSAGDVDDLADDLSELGVPLAFAQGLGDGALDLAKRSIRDWSAPEIALYAAGRELAQGIAKLVARR